MTQARRRESRTRMGVRVDEAWRHIETRRVDDFVSRHISKLPDRFNAVAVNQYVRIDPRIPTAVEYPTISNQNRPLLSSHIGRGQENQRSE